MGIVFTVVLNNQTYKMQKFITLVLLFSLALSASADDHANDTVVCTEESHATSYGLCEGYQSTCELAVTACQELGGSNEETCITTATEALQTVLDAVTFTDCECEIECSGSSMVLLSVFALFAKFLL